MRHHSAHDDDPTGLLAGGDWLLPRAEPDDDLDPGQVWDLGVPGSASALERGCRCPTLPNDPRAGLGRLIAPDCPVHSGP